MLVLLAAEARGMRVGVGGPDEAGGATATTVGRGRLLDEVVRAFSIGSSVGVVIGASSTARVLIPSVVGEILLVLLIG